MKRLFVILTLMLLGTLHVCAQGPNSIDGFRSTVLKEYSDYFEKATLTDNNRLQLFATIRYASMTPADKKRIVESIFTNWSDSLIQVQHGSRRELWSRNKETGSVLLLDQINMNPAPAITVPENYIDTRKHPWFVYFGGQFVLDDMKNITLAANARLGFFLLKDRWDFATTFSGGLTGNIDAEGVGFANVGLMSRVHFPIKKIHLSPSVGGEVTLGVFGASESTVNYSLFLGLSWYVGIGSLDVGINIGNTFYGSGGYTLSPRPKNK